MTYLSAIKYAPNVHNNSTYMPRGMIGLQQVHIETTKKMFDIKGVLFRNCVVGTLLLQFARCVYVRPTALSKLSTMLVVFLNRVSWRSTMVYVVACLG